jgi:hypothetical protein
MSERHTRDRSPTPQRLELSVTTFRTLLNFILCGALLGIVISTLLLRSFIPWYNTPGQGVTQSICDYAVVAKSNIDDVIQGQLIGALIGAVAFLVIGVVVHRRRGQLPPGGTGMQPPAAAPH